MKALILAEEYWPVYEAWAREKAIGWGFAESGLVEVPDDIVAAFAAWKQEHTRLNEILASCRVAGGLDNPY